MRLNESVTEVEYKCIRLKKCRKAKVYIYNVAYDFCLKSTVYAQLNMGVMYNIYLLHSVYINVVHGAVTSVDEPVNSNIQNGQFSKTAWKKVKWAKKSILAGL